MVDIFEQQLVVPLRGPGWQADLVVAPPTDSRPPATFWVPTPEGRSLRPVTARVLYTTATNRTRTNGWLTWHVKIYRCEDPVDADALGRYLRRQAADIQRANLHVEGPSRVPILPPWAVVPVEIVSGDGRYDQRSPYTRPGESADEIISRVKATLPSWFDVDTSFGVGTSFGIDSPAPELYLLAFSPQLEAVSWDLYRTSPGTEHLVNFQSMAIGLDTMHERGMVHCDIKPDNVCRYNNTEVGSGFVLIDADAATRMDPAPSVLRTTEPYIYQGVRAWQEHEAPGLRIDAGRLRAQDRFGFALVVLGALAGRDWVETALLTPQDDDGEEIRRADDRSKVLAELRRHWRDPKWDPLIEVIGEPFGREIEALDWSAAQWLERLLEAERESARRARRAAQEAAPGGAAGQMDRDLAAIRAYAWAVPAPRPQRPPRAYEAVQRRAYAVAARAAVYTALRVAALPVAVVLVILIGAFGLGK